MPGAVQYWFMRRLGTGVPAAANLASLRADDIIQQGTLALNGSGAFPAAPADTTFVVYRNAVAVRALISRDGTAPTSDSPYLPAIGAGQFSNMSQISAGEILALLEVV